MKLYVLCALAFLAGAAPAFGQSPKLADNLKDMIAAASKEGTLDLVWSSSLLGGADAAQQYAAAFNKKFGNNPSYCGYTAYDEVYYIVDAIKRAGATDPDKLVTALEQTDYVGTIGRVQFKGKDTPNPHALKIGSDTIAGLMLQWQDGKQTNLWPTNVANGQLKFPKFIKVGSSN